jgi:hypothetical protein
VPDDEKAYIRGLVDKQKLNNPKTITDDIEICKLSVAYTKFSGDCNKVTVDTYHGAINQSDIDACPQKVGQITFKGNPRDFPAFWFGKTDWIVFEPRSGFVSLNTDLWNVVAAMKQRDALEVGMSFGFVDLGRPSIVIIDNLDEFARIKIVAVLIHGDLPNDYEEQLQYLKTISHPVILLSPYDSQESLHKKMSQTSKVRFFAVYAGSPSERYATEVGAWLTDKQQVTNEELEKMGLRLYQVT